MNVQTFPCVRLTSQPQLITLGQVLITSQGNRSTNITVCGFVASRKDRGRELLSLKKIYPHHFWSPPSTNNSSSRESSCLVSWRCLWGIAHQKSKPFPFTLLWQAGSMSAFAGLYVCGCVISCLCCGAAAGIELHKAKRKVWSAGGRKETQRERLIALWLTQETWKSRGPRRGCHSSGPDMYHHHCCYDKADPL